MDYEITITCQEENPEYKELEERYYGRSAIEPIQEKYIKKHKTIVTLNEEQWQKVQKSIVEAL